MLRRCTRSGRARPNVHSCRPRNSIPKRRCRTGESRWSRQAISDLVSNWRAIRRIGRVSPRVKTAVQKALELSSVPGKATDLEKMYIASIVARRDEKAKDQDEAFVRGLRALVAKYPHEIEAKTYLALMIMRGFTLPDKKPNYPTSTEAVTMLRQLLKDAPDHPGVHHYVIHGFEGSDFAKDAWPSCKRYAELVPNIPHALHMPGHIWAQTGRWDDAIQSFDTAAVNERGYMNADSLYGNLHHAHNVHFLATSYAFRGDYDKAVASAKELLAMKENPREVKDTGEHAHCCCAGLVLADGRNGAVPQVGRHLIDGVRKARKTTVDRLVSLGSRHRACGEGQCQRSQGRRGRNEEGDPSS